jgi:hypothetical protein
LFGGNPKTGIAEAATRLVVRWNRIVSVPEASGDIPQLGRVASGGERQHRRQHAKEDSAANFEQRVKWLLEDLLRPTIARLPGVAQAAMVKAMALIHYRKWKKVGRYNRDLWPFQGLRAFHT